LTSNNDAVKMASVLGSHKLEPYSRRAGTGFLSYLRDVTKAAPLFNYKVRGNGSEDEWKALLLPYYIVFWTDLTARTGDHFTKWTLQTVVIKFGKFKEKVSVYPVFVFVPSAVLNLSFFSFQKEFFCNSKAH